MALRKWEKWNTPRVAIFWAFFVPALILWFVLWEPTEDITAENLIGSVIVGAAVGVLVAAVSAIRNFIISRLN